MTNWNDSLLVGVSLIDNQHRELIKRMDHLRDACTQGKGHEEVEEILKFVVSYVKEHFKDEEEMQAKYAYPEIAEHKKLHAGFVERIIDLLREDKRTGPTAELTGKVNTALIGWFIQHIRTEDKKLGLYIRKAESR